MSRVAVTRRRRIEELHQGSKQTKPIVGTVRVVGQQPTLAWKFYRSPGAGTLRIVGQPSGTVTVSS